MYETFYGLKEKPFSLLPDPAYLYLGHQHSTAYSLLEYGLLSQAGFTAITGDVGCGKTTLIRHLLNRLEGGVTVGLITNTSNSNRELIKWILLAFEQDFRNQEAVELHRVFEDFLISEYAAGRRAVLIVDEAQALEVETLEELRMLSNINADKDLILQLILIGQPQLKTKLERPILKQFAQRISVSYHLGPLNDQETTEYIRHRLRQAGGDPGIFSPQACQRVFEACGGVPRLTNVLCDTALVYGYAEQVTVIGEELVQDVIRERSAGVRLTSDEQRPAVVSGGQVSREREKTLSIFDREQARELFGSLRRK